MELLSDNRKCDKGHDMVYDSSRSQWICEECEEALKKLFNEPDDSHFSGMFTRGGSPIMLPASDKRGRGAKTRSKAKPAVSQGMLSAKDLVLTSKERITEADVQDSIQRHLHAGGWLTVRFNSGGFKNSKGVFYSFYKIFGVAKKYASAGFPDVVAFRALPKSMGVSSTIACECLMVEVKKYGEEARPTQQNFIAIAGKLKIPVHVCDSWSSLETLVVQLNEAEKEMRKEQLF